MKIKTVHRRNELEPTSNTKIFFKELFNFLTAFMKSITGIMNSPTGILWGIVFLLALHPQFIRASPVNPLENSEQVSATQVHISPHSPLDTLMKSFQHEKDFTIYAVESYDASSFTFPLKEIQKEEFNGLTDACNGIAAQHELCLNHPGNCQASRITIDNFEEAMKIHARSLVDLNRVCEMKKYPDSSEMISRCHRNLTWSKKEFATKKFSFFTEVFEGFTTEYLELERGTRVERFIISTPILIGTAIGAASIATAGVTAVVVAKNEVQGVMEAEKIHRKEDIGNSLHNDYVNLNLTNTISKDIDSFRTATDWSSLSHNKVLHARTSSNVINHLFSKDEVFKFSDPQSESFFNAIRERVELQPSVLTESEKGEATRLSASLTTSVTNVVSTSSSRRCDSTVLVKTLVTPIIDYRSRTSVTLKDGKLIRKYGKQSSYILLSQEALVSKKTRMFNQEVQIVGRICTVDNSINASSSPSDDALFEIFTLNFNGTLTITENCPINKTIITEQWTFTKMAKIRLPLVCSISSELFNCSSIKFKSSKLKEIHFSNHRLSIKEQHFEEEKIDTNSTIFISSNIELEETTSSSNSSIWGNMKWPIIGSLSAILFLIILGIGFVSQLSKVSKEGVRVEINNAANANNESSPCTEVAASQGNFIQHPEQVDVREKPVSAPEDAQPLDTPPDYYSTLEIESILAIPAEDRNALETREVHRHFSRRRPSAPRPDLE